MNDSKSPLHVPAPHESGYRHASGEALYVDDIAPPHRMLVAQIFTSSMARARIKRLDVERAKSEPGVIGVYTAKDIPGENDISPFSHDEPLLAVGEVFSVGQHIALVVGEDYRACRSGCAKIEIEYEELPAISSIPEGIERGDFLTKPHKIERGDLEKGFQASSLVLEGEIDSGGQDHFYLESHASLAMLGEDGTLLVHSSTQHPSEVQAKVAEVLGLGRQKVVVETARMGGGFGGKETQGAHFAALAALAAFKTRRPVKVWLNRDQDMSQTGKRHAWHSKYRAGFSQDGRLNALEVDTYSDGGWSADLSKPILDRCLFHLDNAYFIENVRFTGTVVRTHRPSNTAFRGFGGPQGMVVVEEIINRAARALNLDPAMVRKANFYRDPDRNITHYGQVVEKPRLDRIFDELMESSEYFERRRAIDAHNATHPWMKRGIAFQPVKFGISFTNSVLNQAGALVLIYSDGTVQLNHGGTEMGQGLHTKMIAVCAHELGINSSRIRLMTTATDKVPNTSATAASSGSDLNGQAVKAACSELKARLCKVAAELLEAKADDISLADDQVWTKSDPTKRISFSELTMAAYLRQVSLSATGYYRTPNIFYDESKGAGKPFHYFAYGGAVIEVEVNGLTGEHRVLRTEILHDVGDSLVPTIDRGQIEGGFIQGLGWLTCEELIFDERGNLKTHSPDTYKIPAIGEAPVDLQVRLLADAAQHNAIHGSKAVGEPPFMLAIGVLAALRHAIGGFAPDQREIALGIPCTPESVLKAVEAVRSVSPKTAM